MTKRSILFSGAVLGALAVGLGAFGAHALKPMLLAAGRVDTYELAVRYQFYHALALLLVGVLATPESRLIAWAARLMLAGVVLFSGSLYLFALLNTGALMIVTPIGGVFMLTGWIFLALSQWSKK